MLSQLEQTADSGLELSTDDGCRLSGSCGRARTTPAKRVSPKMDMWRATYPFAGDLYVFRGKRGDLLKILWHDGVGMSLYAKRLERGKFIWPSPADGVIPISAGQLGYMLEGIDWRNPQRTWRPLAAG